MSQWYTSESLSERMGTQLGNRGVRIREGEWESRKDRPLARD